MRSKTRARVMRLFLASLLESNLSVRELDEVAQGLTEQSFSWEFGELLQEITIHLKELESTKKQLNRSDNLQAFTYDIVQRRKIPKAALIELVKDVYPDIGSTMRLTNFTVREIIREFLSLASPKKAEKLIDILNEGIERDEYLKGIMRRI